MTDSELTELERLDREATPGPMRQWSRYEGQESAFGCYVLAEIGPDTLPGFLLQNLFAETRTPADAALIVAARNSLGKLLTIARAARAYLEIAGPPRTAAGFLVDPEKYNEARNNLRRALGEGEKVE